MMVPRRSTYDLNMSENYARLAMQSAFTGTPEDLDAAVARIRDEKNQKKRIALFALMLARGTDAISLDMIDKLMEGSFRE